MRKTSNDEIVLVVEFDAEEVDLVEKEKRRGKERTTVSTAPRRSRGALAGPGGRARRRAK